MVKKGPIHIALDQDIASIRQVSLQILIVETNAILKFVGRIQLKVSGLKTMLTRYGFIIRYPKDKQPITGYQYEPWHIRYVGKELSQEL